MAIGINEQLAVIRYLYPFSDRKIVNGQLVVGTDNGTPTGTPIDLNAINWDVEYGNLKLEEAKRIKKDHINKHRDTDITAGVEYMIQGQADVIQTREKDKTVLLALSMNANKKQVTNPDEPIFKFRSMNNNEYMLTPQEMIDLTDAAYGYMDVVYKKSWTLKDQVDTCTTIAEVEAIVW